VKAATWPRPEPSEERLLLVDPRGGRFDDARLGDLPRCLGSGDVLIVNDAATLPASLAATVRGQPLEVRLLGGGSGAWSAIAFGAGDWRTRTEDRASAPALAQGDVLRFGDALSARVLAVDGRVLELSFDAEGAALWRRLLTLGRPIQYAHVAAPLALWHVQTPFASRPWAFELPSAGRPLAWALLGELRRRGVELARVTHAAGISSTGSDELDARFPLPERSEIPEATVRAIADARRRGGRVVAVGTTVVRALESRALDGDLSAGRFDSKLVIGPGFAPRVVQGLLTGMHAPGTSHFAVMAAFAPPRLLEAALAHAERMGYQEHEFGDSCLILPGISASS
jgi:S-adenosylmethionine:tRNA ribosyltransferase-isomerase